jgi:hypothetical protein
LKIRAFDGAFEDSCTVKIKISNVNDNPPVFYPYDGNITITEETLIEGCIAMVGGFKLLKLFIYFNIYFLNNYNICLFVATSIRSRYSR